MDPRERMVTQMRANTNGRIRIAHVPQGEAPGWVRTSWVGIEMDCLCFFTDEPVIGVVTRKKRPTSGKTYAVSQEVALAELADIDPEAARWWREHGFPQKGKCFVFNESEVTVVTMPPSYEELPRGAIFPVPTAAEGYVAM